MLNWNGSMTRYGFSVKHPMRYLTRSVFGHKLSSFSACAAVVIPVEGILSIGYRDISARDQHHLQGSSRCGAGPASNCRMRPVEEASGRLKEKVSINVISESVSKLCSEQNW